MKYVRSEPGVARRRHGARRRATERRRETRVVPHRRGAVPDIARLPAADHASRRDDRRIVPHGRLRMPVDGVELESLKGGFEERRGGRPHEAIDILAPRNTPVLAVESGTIAKLFVSNAGGITIYQFDPSGPPRLLLRAPRTVRRRPARRPGGRRRGTSSATSAPPATRRPTRPICTSPSSSSTTTGGGGRARRSIPTWCSRTRARRWGLGATAVFTLV